MTRPWALLRRVLAIEYTLLRWQVRRDWYITVEWKPADLWRGCFPKYAAAPRVWHVWICLVPMLPIHLWHFETGRV